MIPEIYVPRIPPDAPTQQRQCDAYQAAFLLRQALISTGRWEKAGGALPPFLQDELTGALQALGYAELTPFDDLKPQEPEITIQDVLQRDCFDYQITCDGCGSYIAESIEDVYYHLDGLQSSELKSEKIIVWTDYHYGEVVIQFNGKDFFEAYGDFIAGMDFDE